jgi:hypothetical protein
MKKNYLSIFILVGVLVSGCSSDPYANAGKCESPGESKVIDERVAVCTGIEGKSKWYFEGKYFEDTLLLAKVKYGNSSLTDSLKGILSKENLTVEDYVEVFRIYKITIEELAKFAQNEPHSPLIGTVKLTVTSSYKRPLRGSY